MEKPHRILYPMRAVLISSRNEGKDNIMTACWCFPVSADPPMFAVALAKSGLSHELVSGGGSFVINIPGPELSDALMYCGKNSGRDVDKFSNAGLTKVESVMVDAPSIGECQACIECEVADKSEQGDHYLFTGKAIHIESRKEGKGIYQVGSELKPVE
jgi:flavin reductase (DIM6/NTAB) family NADH-FMN oxidoreductase RutF